MLSRVGNKALRVLDRPGRRSLLTLPGSLWVSLTYRQPCLVRWQHGTWVHHYRGAKIPHATLGRAAPPRVLTAEARNLFLYAYTPRPGDVVLDVGAGIGAETLLFSKLVGEAGRVVSIEAHPRTYRRLLELCTVNRLENVTPLQLAVSDADGSAAIADGAHHARNTLVREVDDGFPVQTRRIETLAEDLGIRRIDLLKMNIEGAERAALAGVGALLPYTRHVCISCHDFLADEGAGDELRTKAFVRAFLLEHGFAVTTRDDAPEPWTRDYVYGVSERRLRSTSERTRQSAPGDARAV